MAANATELFDVFVQAKTALEELPKVTHDLEETKALAQSYADDLTKERSLTEALHAQLASVQAALAQKEAELSDATFRHSESQKLLSGLRDMLGFNSAAHSPVQPEVAKQAEAETPQANPAPETSPAPFAPAPTQASTESQHGVSAPTQAPVDTPETNFGPSDAEAGQSAQGESTSNHSPDGAGVSGSPESGTNTPAFNPPAADRLRYNGQEPWQKPSDITWRTFREGGGSVGYWVHDVDTF